MGSIIIALPRLEEANKIASMIRGRGMPYDLSILSTGSEVLRVANDRDFGVVICYKKLRDMGYLELSEMLPKYFGMIVITKDSTLEVVSDSMVKLMVPFKSSDLLNTIDMISEGFNYKPRKKKATGGRSVSDQKIIDEAKALLMERNGLSEPEAFRYIQKNSMDYGRKLTESAMMVLTMFNQD